MDLLHCPPATTYRPQEQPELHPKQVPGDRWLPLNATGQSKEPVLIGS
jgi:hypothetical protein